MGTFVQVIEFSTSRADEIKVLSEQYRASRSADGSPGPTLGIFTEDKDRPGTYLNIVQFDSYEAAMANSENPLTQEFAQKLSQLVDGPPAFRNLDVLDTWQG